MKRIISILLALVIVFSFAACKATPIDTKETLTTAKQEITGELDITFELSDKNEIKSKEVIDETKHVEKVVITYIEGQKVSEPLLALDLIAGDQGDYGLYIKTVNGITADYDTNGVYWSFYINDEMAMTGVDGTDIDPNSTYKLVVEKG